MLNPGSAVVCDARCRDFSAGTVDHPVLRKGTHSRFGWLAFGIVAGATHARGERFGRPCRWLQPAGMTLHEHRDTPGYAIR